MLHDHDTIVAPATVTGGALAIIRLSGDKTLTVCDRIFRGRRPLVDAEGYTVHYGRIMDDDRIVDDVLVSVFRAPHSYTGEDSAEISCHGSQYIVSEILRLAIEAGARTADPGEFTIRAYLAGKMDLSQAEAVADMIASSSRAAHTLASTQMRGGYSSTLESLRSELLELASLLELELDFSEEDVEFADRNRLRTTMERIGLEIRAMRDSFSLGNALKQGVAVAIAGAPNVGKSTLLNRLLNEERALVSDIAGTTRDVIEETANIDGVQFRFLDTAGIRATDDALERMGIERTRSSISRARIVLYLLDATTLDDPAHLPKPDFTLRDDQRLIYVVNKIDRIEASGGYPGIPSCDDPHEIDSEDFANAPIRISARNGEGIETLRRALRLSVDTEALYHGDAIVSNTRHFEALDRAAASLREALDGLRNGLPTDLLSEEIRQVTTHLGTITGRGRITSDEILTNIFSKFCIGK